MAKRLRLGADTLGQPQFQNALVILCLCRRFIHVQVEQEGAGNLAIIAFAAQNFFAFLDFLLIFHFRADGDLVAVYRDMDILFLYAGYLGMNGISLVVFVDVQFDLDFLLSPSKRTGNRTGRMKKPRNRSSNAVSAGL